MYKYFIILAATLLSFTSKAQQTQQAPWQQHVDYIIDVVLDDDAHSLSGDIAITYTNNSPDVLKEIYIHLWPNAYKNNETAFAKQMLENGETDFYYAKEQERGEISGILFVANGDTLVAEATEYIDVIKLVLNEPLTSGEKRTLFTKFTVKLPKVFSRLGHEDQNYFITQWYPKPAVYDVNGWNPMPYLNQGEFYSEFGTFKVAVTLPSNYTVVATGECMTEGELATEKVAVDTVPVSSTRTKTIQFEADNVHDFAWFASKQWGYETKEIDLGSTKVLARVVGPEPDKKDLDHIETAIKYYSDNVGIYPYSHATVVHGELKAGGGMEYPMITLCDFMSEEVIVHEVGHNWFYGILANNERTYPWMDEAINSYYESEAMAQDDEKRLGDINTTIMLAFVRDKYLTNDYQPIASSSEELTSANYGLSVYGLGAKSFGYLKAYLSADLFRECMRTYYDTWKYKHPLPEDMKRSFEATSGENLSWFFDDVLTSTGKLDYSVKKHEEGYELSNIGAINAPVPVTFTKGEKTNVEWFNVKLGEKLLITKDSSVTLAEIDAKSKTLDLFANNNSSKSPYRLKFGSGRDKADKKDIYWLPTLGWNAYDKTMIGMGVHNYALSDKPFQYHVLPMYSFEKNTVNGTAGIEYIQALKSASQYLELGITAKKYSFQERTIVRDNDGFTEANYNYIKIKPYLTYHFPKVNMRSTYSKTLSLALDQVFLNSQFDLVDTDTLPGPEWSKSSQRSFATLTYISQNTRVLNGYYFEGSLEYGRIADDRVLGEKVRILNQNNDTINVYPKRGTDRSINDFLKLNGLYKYGLDIGIKDKPLEFRVFATYLLKRSNDDIYNSQIGSSNKAGHYDYKFDDFLLHRNAQDGIFQNQIDNSADASKFVGSIGIPDKWLLSANITVPLPGKIPIKPYVEFLVYDDLETQRWNVSKSKMIFNVGLEIEIIKDKFEIFLNLVQSKDVTNYQDGTVGGLQYPGTIDTFGERITFVLDLNGMRPNKLKKSLKLF
jgi:hypothetical protein